MPNLLTVSAILLSFFVTLIILPYWIKRAKNAKLVGPDVHKPEHPLVAELGGLCVIAGFLVSLLFFIATKVFVYHTYENLLYIFAAIISLLIATIIGFVDDILGWKIGLRARYKVALTFFIALPVAVINAGATFMYIPFLGNVEFGLLYPLIIVPVAIMGASNGFNMIAGYNGLEAGQGILLLFGLSLITFMIGNTYLALIGMCMCGALFAFFLYNKYPAKVFPGDVLTYPVGAMVAIIAIIGNIEKYAVVMFIPYFIEFFLKARGKLMKESFAKVNADGTLENQYEKWYGIEHVVIDFLRKYVGKATEYLVVLSIWAVQAFFVALAVGMYYAG